MRLLLFVLVCCYVINMYAPYSDRVSLSGVAEDRVQQTEQHADLIHIAQQLVAPGKGLLAADESTTTMGRRFKKVGVANTLASRAAWRHTLLTTPDLQQHISGVILTEETFYQTYAASRHAAGLSSSCGTSVGSTGSSSSTGSGDGCSSSDTDSGSGSDGSSSSSSGTATSVSVTDTSRPAGTDPCASQRLVEVLLGQGILVGVKVDLGVAPLNPDKITFPSEPQTKGLEGLLERCGQYAADGATFAKWRAVIRIDTTSGWPTEEAVAVNAQQLAEYAAAAQSAGLVPIVEPEVLVMEGSHDLRVSEEVSTRVLSAVIAALLNRGVLLEGLVLKPAMILPGSDSSSSSSSRSGSDEVAAATLRVLRRTVPPAVSGIAFLSGGQTEQQAAQHLAALNQLCRSAGSSRSSSSGSSRSRACMCPWALTFSFGRALQASALQTWAGDQADVAGAQALFGRAVATAGKAAAGVTAAVAEEAAAAEGVDAVGACAAGAAGTCASSVTL